MGTAKERFGGASDPSKISIRDCGATPKKLKTQV